MTNEEIIFNTRMELLEDGVIGSTGRTIEVKDESGNVKTMDEPEEIHTYMDWKQEHGRQVKKGEKSICTIVIWKHTTKPAKDENEPDEERIFQTKAYFFKESQTEKIEQ